MIKTLTIAILAIALGGCGMFDSKDESLTAAPVPATTTAPPAIETLTAAPAVKQTTVETRYINIEPVLDKLNEMGCTVEKLELREVSRGGHVSINCVQQIDPLNVDAGNL